MQGMNVPIKKAAKLLGISEQHLRIKIQRNRFDFASADILNEGGKNYAYFINAKGLAEYLGMTVDDLAKDC